MKLCLFIVFFICDGALAQESRLSRDSVNFYFSRIDNNAVTVTHGRFGVEGMNNDLKKLYLHPGKYAIDKFIDSLDNPEKTLVCHILLTLILDSANNHLYHTSEDMTEKIFFYYKYNGFSWKGVFDKMNLTTELQIDSSQIKNIKKYWMNVKESTRYTNATAL